MMNIVILILIAFVGIYELNVFGLLYAGEFTHKKDFLLHLIPFYGVFKFIYTEFKNLE